MKRGATNGEFQLLYFTPEAILHRRRYRKLLLIITIKIELLIIIHESAPPVQQQQLHLKPYNTEQV